MLKKCLSWSIFLIVILSAVSLMMYFVRDGEVSSKDFPLREKWITNLDGRVETLSTNGDQLIFARTGNKLYSLDVQSGKILWHHDLEWQGVSRPPIALNEIVYLADGKMIWAFDQVNGNVKWTRELPLSSASVDLVSENVVAVEVASYIYVLNAVDGTVLWSKADCRYGEVQAYVEGSRLYSPCIDGLTTMNKSTGKVELETNIPFVVATVAYRDGVMYYSPNRNSISAINLQNKSMLWETSFQAEGFWKFIILGSYLSVAGSDRFCIFQRETGDQVWCTKFTKPQNPTLIGNTLYVFNGYQNNITAFDIATGSKVGELSITNIKFFTVDREFLATTDEVLVFGNGSKVVAFGE